MTHVVPVLADPSDPKLPERVDLVFSCDTYHHMKDRVAYFRSLTQYLKADGACGDPGFPSDGFFSGLLGHGTAAEDVLREMEAAGYRRVANLDLVESQHFQVFSRNGW
jgi:hypothetical protein